MRAKFQVMEVQRQGETSQQVRLMAVTDKPFDTDGKSEDNDFSRWTPSGELNMAITNPMLDGKLVVGQKFYLDFTPAEQ